MMNVDVMIGLAVGLVIGLYLGVGFMVSVSTAGFAAHSSPPRMVAERRLVLLGLFWPAFPLYRALTGKELR